MKKYLFYISQNYSFSILRPIQKELRNRGDEIYWFIEGSSVNSDYFTASEKRLLNIDQVKSYNPDVVVAPANNIPGFIPGLKVAVFHGFDAGKLDRRGQNDHFKIRGCFDLYCTQGPGTTQLFKEKQKKLGYFNVVETGWPALDPLFANLNAASRNEKPVILFCSTFSKRLSCATQLQETISELSRTGKWNWLIQFHPKMDATTVSKYRSMQHEHLSFVETDNIIPLLQKADVMVCDTSSVISMFIVQKKPVVTFKNINPGPYLLDINDSSELEHSIQYVLTYPGELMQSIDNHVKLLHPYQDGQSSHRVINAIDEVLAGKLPVKYNKPLNLIRNLKFRKKLNYWKL